MPDEAPVTSATRFLSCIGLSSKRWSVIIAHSPYDEHHIVRQKEKHRIRPVWVALGNLCTTRCVALGGGARGAYTRGHSETRHGDVCLPEPAPRIRVAPSWRPAV